MQDDITWKNIQKLYLKNHTAIHELVEHITRVYKIPKKVVRDQIKKELISITEKNIESPWYINFIKYYGSLFFVLFSGLLSVFFKKQRIKSDVLYEELWQERSLYSRFYNYIDSYLPKSIKSSIVLNFPGFSKSVQIDKIEKAEGKNVADIRQFNLLFSPAIAFKVFISEFFYFFKLMGAATEKLNVFILHIKLLRKILIYKTQASFLDAKVLISASDYYWGPFKYYFFKQAHVKNIFLIQHNFVGDYITNNFYLSCDYYFAHSQIAIDKKMGFYNHNQFPVGSLQLTPFLKDINNIQNEILVIDQPVHELVSVNSRTEGYQDEVIRTYYLLLNNLKHYLQENKDKTAYYICKPGGMNKEVFSKIREIFKDVENLVFKEAYGKDTFTYISQSKLILNMYSSVGVEAYGLSKRVLWINYEHACDIFGFDTSDEELHVMIDDTSYEAFRERMNLLLSENREVDQHYMKLKEKYMNIQENPAKIVVEKICEILENQC